MPQVDQGELAKQYGLRAADDSNEAAKKVRKQADERKAALVEALAAKCTALLDQEGVQQEAEGAASTATADGEAEAVTAAGDGSKASTAAGAADGKASEDDAAQAAFSQLRQWVDTATDVAHVQLHARIQARAGR